MKSQALNQTSGPFVVRLNIGFKTMKPVSAERLEEDGAKAPLHVAASVVGHERVIPEVSRAEGATHNFTDVDDTCELADLRAHKIPNVRRVVEAFEIVVKRIPGSRRRGPMPVKGSTSPDRR